MLIRSFDSIVIPSDKKTLVLCDIDKTLIRPIHTFSHYFTKLCTIYNDSKIACDYANHLYMSALNNGDVTHTDKEGFMRMVDKVSSLGGSVVFLTARGKHAHEKTIQDLHKAGILYPESFTFHYTNNEITKGEYIRQYQLLDNYTHHIFIDDYPPYLESAITLFPHLHCYLFSCE
jgi:hypothetical protein